MLKIVLLGPPGAGKGTQAKLLAETLQLPQIATGDILRQHIANKTDLGGKASSFMREGKLVPDDVIIAMITEYLARDICSNGYILDGFPRTLDQARALPIAMVSHVLALTVADELIVRRMSGRRVHLGSGRVYHLEFNPPLKAGLDDVTGEPLVQREDDAPDTVADRLQVYHQETKPLLAYYAMEDCNFATIDGVGSIEQVQARINVILLDKS